MKRTKQRKQYFQLPKKEMDDMMWRQLDTLGQILADGDDENIDHYKKEYSKLARKLIPELREQDKAKRKRNADNI